MKTKHEVIISHEHEQKGNENPQKLKLQPFNKKRRQ